MFQDLDSTLKKILNDVAMNAPPIVPPLTELLNAEVSFITPDKTFNPGTPTVNLFLYDVKENRELRDPTPILVKVGNDFVSRQPPVRVDCSYIVTTWSELTNETKVKQEHQLLAQALLWLTRFPTIPATYLEGTLANQIYAPPMYVAQVDPNKNAGEFWDALAIPPRPAFYLTVTIGMELGLQETGALVTTRFTGFDPGDGSTPETLVQIGGRVLGSEVVAVRAEASPVAANGNTATLPDAAAASAFQRGDIVLITEGATAEQATVQSVAGAVITLETNLANVFNAGTMRLADLVSGRRSVRVSRTKGIKPGLAIRITQAAMLEEQIVESVDQTRNVLVLTGGIANTYTMRATDPPTKLCGVVADAIVNLTDAGLRTQSAGDGRFTFLRVPVGNHVIEALAIGFQPKTQPLVVPGRAEDYEIILTPLP
jgi:hypothetical protein